MPKKRLIASLIVRDGWVVQSVGFRTYLPVGRADIAARFLNDWGADEILLLDITASRQGRLIDPDLVAAVSSACHVPLTAGGGIRSTADVRTLIKAGADKVAVNRLLNDAIEQVQDAARVFGNQCILASIDAKSTGAGAHAAVVDGGERSTGRTPVQLAQAAEAAGAGEILLNSIDRDGSKAGFDVGLIDAVANAVKLPVIAMGGAGNPQHVRAVLQRDNVSAAAIGNILHFSEHSVSVIKQDLRANGIDVRIDSASSYAVTPIGADGRLRKRPEQELDRAVFEYVPVEVL